jgi:hypothetical protein
METNNPQKYCTKCKLHKTLNNFGTYFQKKCGKSYVRTYCKDCSKVLSNEYKANNKEKTNQQSKDFRNKNPTYHSEYSNKNKEYFNTYMSQRYYYNKYYEKLLNAILSKNNNMNNIIGCDIENLIKWIEYLRNYCINENVYFSSSICFLNSLKHYNLKDDKDLKKFMNWKNINLGNINPIKHGYLLYCFRYSKKI